MPGEDKSKSLVVSTAMSLRKAKGTYENYVTKKKNKLDQQALKSGVNFTGKMMESEYKRAGIPGA